MTRPRPHIDSGPPALHEHAFTVVVSAEQVEALRRLRAPREGARDVLERLIVDAFREAGLPVEGPEPREAGA